MSTSSRRTSKAPGNTDKARKAALAEVQANIARLDADANPQGDGAGKASKAPKTPKTPNPPKAPKEKKPQRASGLDAVAMVLAEAKEPMNMKAVFAAIQAQGLWKSNGATPEATLYAAVIGEIAANGKESRFKKHSRGLFTAAKGA